MSNELYHTRSAILFIFFNRLDTTLKVLEQIKAAKPARLYLTCDGARATRVGEAEKCLETRQAVLDFIDWKCEVKTLFRDDNLGPKNAISSAITWFFEFEQEGIILEHDCLPATSFFYYCDSLLEKYRFDTRISLVSGFNFRSSKKKGDGSYYFSNLTNGWGWATWRRTWDSYDKDLKKYNVNEIRKPLESIFDNPLIVDRWIELFNDTQSGKIDTWDYQLTFSHLFNHSLTIIPNSNLVSNIGFGDLAENTTDAESPFAAVPLEEVTTLVHPTFMFPQKEADEELLFEEFDLRGKLAYLKKHNSYRRRFKRWLKNVFQS